MEEYHCHILINPDKGWEAYCGERPVGYFAFQGLDHAILNGRKNTLLPCYNCLRVAIEQMQGILNESLGWTETTINQPTGTKPNNMNTETARSPIGETVLLSGKNDWSVALDDLFRYIGTKRLHAYPMNRGHYNAFKGWTPPEGEDQSVEGYIVRYEDGYISWSPKDVFEASYRLNEHMTFGLALEALKSGKKVCRSGWNGKGMFLFLLPAGTIPKAAIHDPKLREILENNGRDSFDALGSIRMKTADNKILTGWLASQTDMLEEDWMVVY